MNVIEAIAEVRARVHDRDSITFGDAEVIGVMDGRLKHMMTKLRTSGDDYGIDSIDVVTSGLTVVSPTLSSYLIPESMYDIQLIEGYTDAAGTPVPFYRSKIEDKELWLAGTSQSVRHWVFGPRNTILLYGGVTGLSFLRIWYVRKLPALFYANCAAGSTALLAVLGTVTSAAYKARSGLYDSFEFEVTAHTGFPANVGQIRRCASQAGGQLTFATAWPAALSATAVIAMVIPLPEEHMEFFQTMVVKKLFERSGSEEDIAMASQDLAYLQTEFESGIARRSSGEPPRLISSRRVGR